MKLKLYLFIRTAYIFALAPLALVMSCIGLASCANGSSSDDYDNAPYTTEIVEGTMSGPFGEARTSSVPQKSGGRTYEIEPITSSKEAGQKALQEAFSKLKPGDTLILNDGTYYGGAELKEKIHGTFDNWIVVKPKNKGKAIITDGDKANESCRLLRIYGSSYIKFDGLVFDGAKRERSCGGIKISPPSHHIVISNCTFKNIQTTKLEKNSLGSANAIVLWGDSASASINNVLITDNKLEEGITTGKGECITLTGNCEYINVVNNSLKDTGNIGIIVAGSNPSVCPDPSKNFARFVLVKGNTCVNCQSPSKTSAAIYVDGGMHVIIDSNTLSVSDPTPSAPVGQCGISLNSEKEISVKAFLPHDILIQNNTINYFGSGAIRCGVGGEKSKRKDCYVGDVIIENNKCDGNAYRSGESVLVFNKCRNITVRDNTFTDSKNMTGGKARKYSFTFNKSGYNLSDYTQNVVIDESNSWSGYKD